MAALNSSPTARGVLDPRAARRRFDLSLRAPAPELADLVEHYWIVRWNLSEGDSHPQHTIPHPSVHLVTETEPGRSGIFGVMTGRFTRLIEGSGRVFGIKFRPAGFHTFLGPPVRALTDRVTAVREVFGEDGDALAARVRSLEDESGLAEAADTFVRGRLPAPDPLVAAVNQVVGDIMTDRRVTTVADVTRLTGIGERRLQRLFAEYVGIGPKWVIRRYRIIEAAERLAAGEDAGLAALAADLGYCDQAHFARDFRTLVGRPPAVYAQGNA